MNRSIPKNIVATFSIVGYDPQTDELGIAVQSKFLAVGSAVPWAKAGVGAIATQSYANTSFGPKGLALMAEGKTARETLDSLIAEDDGRDLRQVGIVDAKGNAATYTGSKCYDWAGGITGEHYAAQGNILVSQETVEAMGRTFEGTKGSLAERLLRSLDAGQAAGGDSRGKQSAALLIVKENGGYGGFNDRAVDLRVDDHPDPIRELIRIYNLHQLYFGEPRADNIVEIDEEIHEMLVRELERLDYLEAGKAHSDMAVYQAFIAFIHTENFEQREQEYGKIDLDVLKYLRNKPTN